MSIVTDSACALRQLDEELLVEICIGEPFLLL
jgi:hypothetical protein